MYRVFSLIAVFILMIFPSGGAGLFLNSFQLVYLALLALFVILYFVLLCFTGREKSLLILLALEYFTVFFYAYVENRFLIMELIWIPGIIAALAFMLPKRTCVPALLSAGILMPVFLSYGHIYGVSVSIGGEHLPYTLILAAFLAPVTLLSLILNILCFRTSETEERYSILKDDNKRLNEINHAISQRIFSLQNDTNQKERNRLSKEIHDTAGYVFVNLIMMLQAAQAILRKDMTKANKLIGDARDYAEKGINEIRHLLRDIRDYTPVSMSLQNEFYHVGESFEKATGVEIDIEYGPWPKTFLKNLDSFFISFMQEALTNALKHGHAKKVSVLCWDDGVCFGMTITDNGSGAVLPIKKGIGITAMEDAATEFGGTIAIKSGGGGFKISVTIPLSRAARRRGISGAFLYCYAVSKYSNTFCFIPASHTSRPPGIF
jgi:signal transduction histidine kinase